MPSIRPRRAPLWFVVLVVVACAAAVRVWTPASPSSSGAGDPTGPITLAIFGWIVLLVEAIWKGVEVAGRITLVILQYSVTIAWRAIALLGKGATELAGYAWKGAKIAWDLLGRTYEHVLKPAWRFFWKWVDRVEQWLQRTFGPVLSWLRRVRTWILDFWSTYIRPILDLVDITRRALHVLGALGLEWARTLDRRLGAIEDWIDRRFQDVLGTLNDVINVVNRIMTADGLFQRLTFLRTIARDYAHAWSIVLQGFNKPLGAADRDAMDKAAEPKPLADVHRDVGAYLRDRSGADAALFTEVGGQWSKYLRGSR